MLILLYLFFLVLNIKPLVEGHRTHSTKLLKRDKKLKTSLDASANPQELVFLRSII